MSAPKINLGKLIKSLEKDGVQKTLARVGTGLLIHHYRLMKEQAEATERFARETKQRAQKAAKQFKEVIEAEVID